MCGSDVEAAGAVVTSDALPMIRVSPMLLGQILQNLISNALKFRNGTSPHIHVGAEAQAGAWRFNVRDNGLGIPEDAHARIFGLFSRLGSDGAGDRRRPGAVQARGREARRSHLGRVAPGEGSTFYFTIPERSA